MLWGFTKTSCPLALLPEFLRGGVQGSINALGPKDVYLWAQIQENLRPVEVAPLHRIIGSDLIDANEVCPVIWR